MTLRETDRYIAYLKAKKSVDDRALNRHVWQSLRTALPAANRREPIRAVELGAGTGAMLDRIRQWELTEYFDYTMVDINPDYLAARVSAERQPSLTAPSSAASRKDNDARVSFEHEHGTVTTVCADLHDFLDDPANRRQFRLAIAHAVMDLVDIDTVLAGLRRIVRAGGLLYLSLNYDGWTCLLPPVDSPFEKIIFDRYHRSMDRRTAGGRPAGASRTGRLLFDGLERHQMPILAAGSSDWIVCPRHGRYGEDDAFFLKIIIQTIHRQLRQDAKIDQNRLSRWVSERTTQIETGRLTLIARNFDFLATVSNV